jgi:spore maturation protein CgeB
MGSARGGDVRIAFLGSSILSSYWNGAATYYRGILRGLADLGYRITFYEPDAYGRQQNRDFDELPWVKSVVYAGHDLTALEGCVTEAREADIVVKASGVGVFDELLEHRIANLGNDRIVIFWDVDAPATLDRVLSNTSDAFRSVIGRYDAIFTYGGGQRVVDAYQSLGARACIPIYNAVDTDTHFPVTREAELSCCLAFQGNRLPDRERRVDEFFFRPASHMPEEAFILGGSGWDDKPKPSNVRYIGHVGTQLHNAFNSSAKFVLNINRDSMASYGFSPPTRVFEAAASAACLISDAWEGIEMFLEPGREILIAQDGDQVAGIVRTISDGQAREFGQAARKRVLTEHTYAQRALQVDAVLRGLAEVREPAQRVFA